MNLRTVARRLLAAHPSLWFVLPDLRGHGNSETGASPHTLGECARDLARLESELGQDAMCRIGHSFGGKVVLERFCQSPALTVLMDTLPESTPNDDPSREWMRKLIQQLSNVPTPLASRAELNQHLGSYGSDAQFCAWMGTNLTSVKSGGFSWRFSLPTIGELIEDYWDRNLMGVLGHDSDVHVLFGQNSERFSADTVARLANQVGIEKLHEIEGAGHWIHADNPEGTIAALSGILRTLEK